MKVLIYSHFFAPVIGGAESYARLLATGLSNAAERETRGAVEVTVATETPADGFMDSSLPFRVVRRPGLRQLFQLLHQTDIVHVVGPCVAPMLIAWMIRKPFIVEQHGYQSVCPNGLLVIEPDKRVCPGHFMARNYGQCLKCNKHEGTVRSLRMWVLTFVRRWLCARAKVNIAISNHLQRRMRLRNSRTIYYGIPDLGVCEGAEGNSSCVICFAYLGRLVPEKGIGILIDAAGILKEDGRQFRLKIIGDGPERQDLERLAKERGLSDQVAFTGLLSGQALRNAMSDVSVVVMPSQWEETAGLSAMEQMMRGRLVICADVGGLGEMVDGAGLKFEMGNAAALAASMRSVMKNPGIVREFGQRARERALHFFTFDRMINDHLSLYLSVLEPTLPSSEPAAEIQ
jgi:glycosyltransferase involved in cell wall biosynthesis